ncbi:hypothetical protein HOLleu_40219 [Holothuria leucospilota]|uniref:Uncharacterized protein n=1 Tax=Holothuria leucospilota TaxID=206669 RepID=A0A9Q0YD51_HOLLE|nr:hypothetical protein HOLleu_40219 [Holothuria leucospilota]
MQSFQITMPKATKSKKGVAVTIRTPGAVTVKVSGPKSASQKRTGVVAKPKNKAVVPYRPPKVKPAPKKTTTTVTKRVTQTITVKKTISKK